MKSKLIFKYILLYIPFVIGVVLFGFGKINLISSLLLFLGGYVAIKNTFDYRNVRKNINSIKIDNNSSKKSYDKSYDIENAPSIKNSRRRSRVRKRTK